MKPVLHELMMVKLWGRRRGHLSTSRVQGPRGPAAATAAWNEQTQPRVRKLFFSQ